MMRTRRWPAVLAIVAAVLVLADLAVDLAQSHLRAPQTWPTPELQKKYGQLTALSRGRRPAVVVIGDSLMDAGVDPAGLGMAGGAFNAALSGETLGVIAPWATEVVIPRLHPRVVVLGFSANVLNGDISGERALVSGYTKSRTVRYTEGNGDLLDNLDGWLRQHVALYRERSVLRQPFSSPSGSSVYDPPLSNQGWNEGFAGGHLQTGPASTMAAMAAIKADLLSNFELGAGKVDALGRLIDQLRNAGVEVVLVAMPVSADFAAAIPGGTSYYQMAIDRLLATGKAHGALISSAGEWPAADFADAAHLNKAGTARMTAWMSSELAQVVGARP